MHTDARPQPMFRKAVAHSQSGAVLYVALIMLVLMALIGIVGMQVTGMQERMAANYRAANIAFQSAENRLRTAECTVQDLEDGATTPGCNILTESDIRRQCNDGYDIDTWLSGLNVSSAPAVSVRQIDECIVGESSVAQGIGPLGNVTPIRIYQVTVYDVDSETNRTSAAAIDSVYKL